ncbi:MAG: DNA polymerase III subunit alpha [Chlorobi bacterium]|nr:DNA polymerase III subunit alpha [Chlorobiota bacterium]
MYYLIFDTETTGLPEKGVPFTEISAWPRMVQIAWQLHDDEGRLVEHGDFLVRPEGFNIPFEAQRKHGISTELASAEGKPLEEVLDAFEQVLAKADFLVGHNLSFDIDVLSAEFIRTGRDYGPLRSKPVIDTMSEATAEFCQLPGGKGKRFKFPRLGELYQILFNETFDHAHNATADVEATARAFFELVRRGIIGPANAPLTEEAAARLRQAFSSRVPLAGLRHRDLFEASRRIKQQGAPSEEAAPARGETRRLEFAHLHVYSQFSILQSTVNLDALVKKTAEYGMRAVAVTDKNNMFGTFRFWKAVQKHNKKADPSQRIKPVLGVELNVCRDHTDRTRRDDGHTVVLLAKNKKGYENLIKLVTKAHLEGKYYNVPRVDKNLLRQYREGLIALSGGLEGEIPHYILKVGEAQAEEKLKEWLDIFGDDFYLEVMRHGLEEEEAVNETLKRFASKYGIKLIATNQVHYLEPQDYEAHEILLSVRDGKKLSDPVGPGKRMRKKLPVNEYYFKSQTQMIELFETDMPSAIANISDLLDKIEDIDLSRPIIMPRFDVPAPFRVPDDADGKASQAAYLRHLVYEGARKRWGELTPDIRQRLDYELDIINGLGFAGYFLIVWDVIRKAREMGVAVGPGRGSAAGSAVAYTLEITNVDPIKYSLLFERFLNPNRVSMPDIDMDFDDIGRNDVIRYVVDKYGYDKVAHIITYGEIGAKTAIRDTFRVMGIDLALTNRIAKLAEAPLHVILDNDEQTLRRLIDNRKHLESILAFKRILAERPELEGPLRKAATIEGAYRNRGIHACGFIISPEKLENVIPLTDGKGTDLLVTQYDAKVVEDAGFLKMDFLGIKTLSIIKDAIRMIEKRHGVKVDPDRMTFDDDETYRLFREARTVGVFQFESEGMRKSLKSLRPTEFEDLIAMVALYRPGPMDKIPVYVARKHGLEKVEYDLPEMEEILKPTYGIAVYQEQVMLLSQKIAGFSGSKADELRRAMAKKIKEDMVRLYEDFIRGGMANGHPREKLEKIWKDWESFASYAFNRSHAVSYAVVAYHTGWLKAHYPAEFLAASLSHHLHSRDKVTNFIEDAKNHGIKVLPPDVNESDISFTVNAEGNIRFGLAAIKGVGESAAMSIIREREKGPFTSIYDFIRRVNPSQVNMRVLEGLALAGAFDRFGFDRDVYVCNDNRFLHRLVKYGVKYREEKESPSLSLFAGMEEMELPEPKPGKCDTPMAMSQLLEVEKDLLGFYVSGHPLDMYRYQVKFFRKHDSRFVNAVVEALNTKRNVVLSAAGEGGDDEEFDYDAETGEIIQKEEDISDEVVTYREAKFQLGKPLRLAGFITEVRKITTKTGKNIAFYKVEDYDGEIELGIFGELFIKKEHLLKEGMKVAVTAMVEERFNQPGQYQLRTLDLRPLENVLDEMAKGVEIRLREVEVTPERIGKLADILTAHKGKKELRVALESVTDKFSVTLASRKVKIDLDSELLTALEDEGFDYRIF